MIGQYLVVNCKVYSCTWYAVMGPKLYKFAATQAALHGRVFNLP